MCVRVGVCVCEGWCLRVRVLVGVLAWVLSGRTIAQFAPSSLLSRIADWPRGLAGGAQSNELILPGTGGGGYIPRSGSIEGCGLPPPPHARIPPKVGTMQSLANDVQLHVRRCSVDLWACPPTVCSGQLGVSSLHRTPRMDR